MLSQHWIYILHKWRLVSKCWESKTGLQFEHNSFAKCNVFHECSSKPKMYTPVIRVRGMGQPHKISTSITCCCMYVRMSMHYPKQFDVYYCPLHLNQTMKHVLWPVLDGLYMYTFIHPLTRLLLRVCFLMYIRRCVGTYVHISCWYTFMYACFFLSFSSHWETIWKFTLQRNTHVVPPAQLQYSANIHLLDSTGLSVG